MKKTGCFFFSFIPMLLAVGIQILATLFLFGIYLLMAFPSMSFSRSTFSNLLYILSNSDFSTVLMIIYSLIVICSYGIWYYHSYGGNFLPSAGKIFQPYKLVGVLFLVPGMQLLSSYLISILAVIFPSWLEAYEKLLESAGLDETITLAMLIYSVFLAPIGEELIFRGVTMRIARRHFSFWFANLLQAFLFGLYHMNMIQGCYAFCLGLILGYVCERGGSIYYSMFLHFLFNIWGTLISEHLSYGNTPLSFVFFLIVAVVLTASGISVFRLGMRKKPLPDCVC